MCPDASCPLDSAPAREPCARRRWICRLTRRGLLLRAIPRVLQAIPRLPLRLHPQARPPAQRPLRATGRAESLGRLWAVTAHWWREPSRSRCITAFRIGSRSQPTSPSSTLQPMWGLATRPDLPDGLDPAGVLQHPSAAGRHAALLSAAGRPLVDLVVDERIDGCRPADRPEARSPPPFRRDGRPTCSWSDASRYTVWRCGARPTCMRGWRFRVRHDGYDQNTTTRRPQP